MAKLINLPDVGSDSVTVTEIFVTVGMEVVAEQPLLTVEGDKAAMEIPAPAAGRISAILLKVGDKVQSGVAMVELEEAGTKEVAKSETTKVEITPTANVATSSVTPLYLPDVGGDSVTVTEILVQAGDSLTTEQAICTVEGDKAAMEIPAPLAGTVESLKIQVGDKIKTGALLLELRMQTSAPTAPPSEISAPAAPTPIAAAAPVVANDVTAPSSYVHASPAVRRLGREFGVDLSKVKGSGRKGRITKEDVQAYVKAALQAAPTVGSGSGLDLLPWPKVDFGKFGEVEVQPLTKIQKLSGANLHRNWVMIPHVTQFDYADITELEAFRQQENQQLAKEKSELKLTPLVFILKAVAKTLELHPRFNSSLSDDGQSLVLKKYIHIGVAVDTPNGLVVPVVRDVNRKGLLQLARELGELSTKAREGKLSVAEMQGGCFSISSLGGIGGSHFTPIVNAPEVAILGVSKSSLQPQWNGHTFEPRLQLPLALSYDHRVIDGAAGARFVTTLATLLGDIRNLVL